MKDRHYFSNYAESHDIDCFFRIGDDAFHFASNGQPIPDFILRNKNIEIQNAVYERLPNANGEYKVRTETIKELLHLDTNLPDNNNDLQVEERYDIVRMIEDYTVSFVEMARLGFVSMDVDEEGRFWVIAEPKDKGKVPDDILRLLPEGRIDDLLK